MTHTNGHVKHFVLDTNVLLHNPNALFMFADNEVIIPFDVIEELDKFKTNSDDLGRNARTVIRHLDSLRLQGKLSEGVNLPQTGGRVRVILEEDQKLCPGLTANTPDNRIICCAFGLMQEGMRVVFISKDINARIKSDAMGLVAEDFEAQKVDFDASTPAGAKWPCRPGPSIGSSARSNFAWTSKTPTPTNSSS